MPEPTRSDALVQRSEGEVGVQAVLEEPESAEIEVVETEPGSAAAAWATARRRKPKKRFGVGFWLAVAWLVLLVVLAVTADVLPFVDDPEDFDPLAFGEGPSSEHWLGGDTIGRDI